jgi:RNAse (barnase) inhibitor barstar
MKHIVLTNHIDLFREYSVIPLDSDKIHTQRGFYEEIAESLEFPEYFGFNLDSLDEMINDLSWLEDQKIVIYIQDSTSFLSKERNPSKITTILELLEAACEEWRWVEDDKKELKIVFNDSERIQKILTKAAIDFEVLV